MLKNKRFKLLKVTETTVETSLTILNKIQGQLLIFLKLLSH